MWPPTSTYSATANASIKMAGYQPDSCAISSRFAVFSVLETRSLVQFLQGAKSAVQSGRERSVLVCPTLELILLEPTRKRHACGTVHDLFVFSDTLSPSLALSFRRSDRPVVDRYGKATR